MVKRGHYPEAKGKNKGRKLPKKEYWDEIFSVYDQLCFGKGSETPRKKLKNEAKTSYYHYEIVGAVCSTNYWFVTMNGAFVSGSFRQNCSELWDWVWHDDAKWDPSWELNDYALYGSEGASYSSGVGGGGGYTYYDCAGVANGRAYEADCGCIGGTTGKTSCFDIENNVDNPCLKKVVQSVIDADIRFDVERSLKSLFNTNENINLYLNDDVLAWNTSGEAFIRYKREGELGININLNQNTLPYASKEYIVSTIIHEALHAYFRERNSLPELDHELMANHYVEWFKEIMLNAFPHIDPVDNWGLAWDGLAETAAWSRMNSAERILIQNINDNYKTMSSGKGTNPCP